MDQQEHVARMTDLGAVRDQSTNENTKLDERIGELSLRKNMVNHFVSSFFLLIEFYFRCLLH
jgi:hypothetical protein